jgi:uncharacterized protein (DUF697 family)
MDIVETRFRDAEHIVNGYVGWASGAGLIPIPGLDLAGIGAVQIKMLNDLSKLYDVPFSKNAAKLILGTLAGSGGAVLLTLPATSLLKLVPIVGHIAAMFTEPAAAAATTYALGKVFILHFESGGTMLDFNPEAMRKYYDEQVVIARAGKPAATVTVPKPA